MESWTFPIEYKNFPFDKSTESIESTKVYGALPLRRYKNSQFDKSIESTKGYGSYYNGDIFRSLANEMQQSNGMLDFSNRI